MPRMRWILSWGAFLLWAQTVMAGAPLYPGPDCPCQPKCRALPTYSLSPGCCDSHRHCFDNAWDGYCQERARWDTFWCKLGTGAFLCPCTPCATYGVRAAGREVCVPPAAAACGCSAGSGPTIPAMGQ